MSRQEVAAGFHHHDDGDGFCLWNERYDLQDNETITRVRVDDTITVIPRGAFRGCSNLREVQLPIGLLRLNGWCFDGCKSLKQIYLRDSIEEMGQFAFGHSGLEEVKIPKGVTEIGRSVFFNCSFLVKVELHENVSEIGEFCFAGCSSLRTIELPSSLRVIGQHAFHHCGLELICLPSNVSIGEEAFWECEELKKVIFPQSMGGIRNHVFCGCQNICALQLPRTTTETHLTTTEQKLITELCRTDGQSAMDRIGMDLKRIYNRHEKDNNSTVQTTCLFSFLNQNDFRILKSQGQSGKRKRE